MGIFEDFIQAELPLRLISLKGDGDPTTNGVVAPKYSRYTDNLTDQEYRNIGTAVTPNWEPLSSGGSSGGGGGTGEWLDSIDYIVAGTAGNPFGSATVLGDTVDLFNDLAVSEASTPTSKVIIAGDRFLYRGSNFSLNTYDVENDAPVLGSTVVDGSILTYIVGDTNEGWALTTPVAGNFSSLDTQDGRVIGHNGSEWSYKDFESTVPVRQIYSLMDTVLEDSWQLVIPPNSVVGLDPVDILSEYQGLINSRVIPKGKLKTGALPGISFTLSAVTILTDSTFDASDSIDVGTTVVIDIAGTLYYRNILEKSGTGPYIYTISTLPGLATASSIRLLNAPVVDNVIGSLTTIEELVFFWNPVQNDSYIFDSNDEFELMLYSRQV